MMIVMFTEMLEEAVALTDGELNDAIRASEVMKRRQDAQRSALIAVAEQRGLHRVDGHHSLAGYLRATTNASDATISRQRTIAAVVDRVPAIGEALAAGHVGESQVLQIARIHTNPRTREFLPAVASIYLERAEHAPYADLRDDIGQFLQFADQDGAFAELASAIEHRTARVSDIADAVDISASGGDPITACRLVAIFEGFVQREFDRDVEARRVEFGDDAESHPLPRTAAQRRFDALANIMERAAGAPADDGRRVDTVVNVIIDERSLDDAFTRSGLLPDGSPVELDDDTLGAVIDAAASDPTGWVDRRCETDTGQPVHPLVALRAAVGAYIRRVVVDSDGIVVDHGRRQRLFAGPAREAAKLLVRRCGHPGCNVPVRFAEVDHLDEWFDGGRTDQRNSGIRCRSHNRFKHRERWRTHRDAGGRQFSIRPDGTVVLPAGARPPDLSADELNERARARLAALRHTVSG
jgi:hypothetical protein